MAHDDPGDDGVSARAGARAAFVRGALGAALLAASASLAACSSCKGKSEPLRDPAFDPSSDAAPRPSASAARGASPADLRDRRTRLDPDLCGEAAKRVNMLHGRPATDPIGVDIVSTCLRYGSVAWYRCVLSADAAPAADACGRKFLEPPDER